MEYFEIDSIALDGDYLPEPAKGGAVFSVQDIDSSETGRNQNGDMMRERVATKVKWQLTFPPLNRRLCANLLNALSGVTFEFTYPDPYKESGTTTKTCYVGDRTTPIYSMVDGVPMWENISFAVVEM